MEILKWTAACFFFLILGIFLGENNSPEPCIRNFERSVDMNTFAQIHQDAINDTEQQVWFEGSADERVMSRRDWTLELFERMDGQNHERAVRGEHLITNDTYFVVPANCYATELDSMFGPLLLKKEE
jgi:hypothetical protein